MTTAAQGAMTQARDHRLLDGRAVRDRILADVAERVREASTAYRIGRLVSVSIGEHKEVAVYVRGRVSPSTPTSESIPTM